MPALLTGTTEYAAQVLRNQKVETLDSRRNNQAGRPPEDLEALSRQRAIEAQVNSNPNRFKLTDKDLLRQPGVDEVISTSTTASQIGDQSTMILSSRGTFYLVKLATMYGPGLYAIDELTREVVAPNFTGPTQPGYRRPGEFNSPILLTSIEFNQVDITNQVPCLDNVKVFYSFGQNFGQVAISGEILMGPLGAINYDGVNRLVDFFWKNRVSVKKKPIAVSAANNSYFVYLTGLRIGQVNADFHILPFTMFGTLLDIEREKANIVNTSGTVITEGSLTEPSLFAALTAPLPGVSATGEPARPKQDVPATGETVQKVSPDNDPALNEAKGGSGSNVGTLGNSKATEIDTTLNNTPPSVYDAEIEQLKSDRAARVQTHATAEAQAARIRQFGVDPDKTVSFDGRTPDSSKRLEADVARYDLAIKGAEIKKAQDANLAAGTKVQELTLADRQALMAFETLQAERNRPPSTPLPVY